MISILKKETPSRIYYKKNKERILKQQKEYNAKKSKERMNCCCGKNIFVRNQDRHETSLRHRRYIYKTAK